MIRKVWRAVRFGVCCLILALAVLTSTACKSASRTSETSRPAGGDCGACGS